ncbi:GumC family protein [Scytonema sp. NUACC26]|uniref:GumC family protein n=1 Tax=Scytonema sp. NUACC26 TaxID=3140176 RepID=UPI0038B2E6FF
MELQESSFILDKYWHVAKRRWLAILVVFFPAFIIFTSASFMLKKPYYEAEGKLIFERTNTISSLTGVGTEIGKLESVVQEKSNPLSTEAEIIRSIPIVKKVINQLNLQGKDGEPLKYKDFLKQLTVNDIQRTDILKVSYMDTNPVIAARVANALMANYLDQNISAHRTQASVARKFLEKQVPNAELIVKRAEAELRGFKEKNKVVALGEEATKAVEVIAELHKQRGSTESEIANLDSQAETIRQQLSMNLKKAVTTTSLSQTSGVQDILKEVQQTESQLAVRRTVLQGEHPEIQNLENKLAVLQQILQRRTKQVAGTTPIGQNDNLQVGLLQQQLSAKLAELESTYQGLSHKVSALNKLETIYRERLKKLPYLEQQQHEAERNVQVAQSTYLLLQQKLQESRIAENQNIGNARMASAAEIPDEPVSSRMLVFVSAALFASMLSLAIVYLLEATDKSIKTIDEAKQLLGLTLLGVIPSFYRSKKLHRNYQELELQTRPLVVRDMPRSYISEAFRMLRANLKFVSADKEIRVIVVTSSIPQEGKSTVAANLAIAMAQMERKVLLIDGDLHRPVQQQIWELPNSKGLSNVIVGQADIKTAIAKVMDNLYVLTSGVVPPSPASLLDSKRMATLIDILASQYDFVIVDAPSLTVAADAVTLGQMADGVLFVVRPGVIDATNAIFAKELLEKSGQNILGQVVNGVTSNNERHSYYFTKEYSFETQSVGNRGAVNLHL